MFVLAFIVFLLRILIHSFIHSFISLLSSRRRTTLLVLLLGFFAFLASLLGRFAGPFVVFLQRMRSFAVTRG